MTVMRHWVARAPSGDRVARVLDTAEKAEHYREALGFDVSGLFVLESATQGAVEAERARVVAYVRGRGSDCWDPGVEAALRQVAAEIERDHHHGGR